MESSNTQQNETSGRRPRRKISEKVNSGKVEEQITSSAFHVTAGKPQTLAHLIRRNRIEKMGCHR